MLKKFAILFFGSIFLLNACQFLPSDEKEKTLKSRDDETRESYSVDSGDLSLVEGETVGYGIKYDPDKWVLTDENENVDLEYEFEHVDGDVYSAVIAERITMDMDALRDLAIDNVKSVSSDFELVSEDTKSVNGNEILVLQMNAKVDGIPVTYYGYYYVGEIGSIQFTTFTGQNLFDEYKEDLDEFLSGLEIYEAKEILKSDRPESLVLVEGKKVDYGISYDENTWIFIESESGAESEYEFDHVDGDVYAFIIPERLTMSRDVLKDLALTNAKEAAEDVEIIAEEIRNVDGQDVLMMKMRGTLSGIVFQYYGYYYTGDVGTIQFITYSSENLVQFYGDDLTKLLDGLRIYSD